MKSGFVRSFAAMVLMGLVVAQEAVWVYEPARNIRFSAADSLNNPFECATDLSGNLWVISSRSTSLHAVDALYKAAPGDTLFTLVDDYSDDPTVHSARGVTAIGNDIYVVCRSVTENLAFMYRYPQGDFSQRTMHNPAGFGTYVYGISATLDGYVYGGIIYQGPKIRVYDFTGQSQPLGLYVSPDCANRDPGGPTATGEDAIRDVAVLPNGDYNDINTPVYTSRNSLEGGNTGGVTKWTGGTQTAPQNYSGVSLDDADSFLRWTRYVPNGLTVDQAGRLWAVGTDTARRWVKVFEIDGNWATQVNELPSSTSGDIADPLGAPLNVPEDVALSPCEEFAYVIDVGNHICYTFRNSTYQAVTTADANHPHRFILDPVFPNPFNHTSRLRFGLPEAGPVTIQITNLRGEVVSREVENVMAGYHLREINLQSQPTGVYLISVQTARAIQIRKVVYLK